MAFIFVVCEEGAMLSQGRDRVNAEIFAEELRDGLSDRPAVTQLPG
jgi:hypothetical protein